MFSGLFFRGGETGTITPALNLSILAKKQSILSYVTEKLPNFIFKVKLIHNKTHPERQFEKR
jgi:hypothetical protein